MDKGQRIKARRIELGKSQTEVAERIHVSKQTLYKYENGIVTNIPSDKIEAIASVLEVEPSYIMGWEEPASPPRVLRPDESHLLTDYNKLNDTGKGKVREYASDLTEQEKYTVDKKENAVLSEAG